MQFRHVLTNGLRVTDGLFQLYMAENDCGHLRVGISVGKYYGNAVARNRLKRMLREVLRQSVDEIPSGFDYVLVPSIYLSQKPITRIGTKKTPEQPNFEQIRTSMLNLVQTALKQRFNRKKKINTISG